MKEVITVIAAVHHLLIANKQVVLLR